ncbi:hypothetical protein P3W85_28285 [Cupriavidus basilensis]|uniref:Flagellar biosynthetic protein FliO n=1 Tax=Cupriavidus basilensis TaxID=68895 RepID=A0ABT6AW15_9BURK|nr:hypothetical protein [Cupriavidus basilensis]MDF3836819.1 hypothetical protein [Cupriavidus basilensis]
MHIDWLRIFAAFIACLLAGMGAIFVLHKQLAARGRLPANTGAPSRIRLLEVSRIHAPNPLYLIEVDGQKLLLVRNAQGLQLISPIAPTQE